MKTKEVKKMLNHQKPLVSPKRIELVYTSDPYTKLKAGDRGYETGNYVDPWGKLTTLCNWDNGSTLSMVSGEDRFKYVVE